MKVLKIKKNLPSYYNYRIRLFRSGRYKKPFYKIVIVNSFNRIISQVGYYNPHADGYKNKIVGIDRSACLYWILEKKAIPSVFVFFILQRLSLIKH